MSLQKARARYYASHFESESSDDDFSEQEENLEPESSDESSEEEYFQVSAKKLTPKQRLQKRLEKIRFDFQKAAPSVVAEEKFHIYNNDMQFEDNFDHEIRMKREIANPIQVALERPSKNIGTPRPLEFDNVADCSNVAADIEGWPTLGDSPVTQIKMDDKIEKNNQNFLDEVMGCAGVTLVSAGFTSPDDSVEQIDEVDKQFQDSMPYDPTERIDVIDAQSGVPAYGDGDFHQWLTDKFGPANVPENYFGQENPLYKENSFEDEALPSDESWAEWPEVDCDNDDNICCDCGDFIRDCECENICSMCEEEVRYCDCMVSQEVSEADPEPNPMDMKGNNIAKRLAGLEAELQKIEENKNVLIVEKENLASQLKACKKRIKELEKEHEDTSDKIEEARAEQEAHISEMDKMHSMTERKKRENQMVDDIKNYLDDFSQAVQILLSSGKYCDFEQLIHAHVKDGMYVQNEVRNSIIKEAKIMKRDQLYSTLEADNCYLSPKNEDQLPNLYDQYVTDSYMIIQENN
jgi:hypothetical protein